MAESRSALHAKRTQDGGAIASFTVGTSKGPLRFNTQISGNVARKIHDRVVKLALAGHPQPGRAALMGADPDAPLPMSTGLRPKPAKSYHPDVTLPPTFRKTPHVSHPDLLEPVAAKVKSKAKKFLFSFGPVKMLTKHVAPNATIKGVNEISNDAIMGAALHILRKKVPGKYSHALGCAAKSALVAKKSAMGDFEFDKGFHFFEDEEHDPMAELSQWVADPLGIPDAHEEAAIISGETTDTRREATVNTDEEIKGAKIALLQKYSKAKAPLQGIKFEGRSPEGRMRFLLKTPQGIKGHEVMRSEGGWIVTSMSGAEVGFSLKKLAKSTVKKVAKGATIAYKGTKAGVTTAAKKAWKYGGYLLPPVAVLRGLKGLVKRSQDKRANKIAYKWATQSVGGKPTAAQVKANLPAAKVQAKKEYKRAFGKKKLGWLVSGEPVRIVSRAVKNSATGKVAMGTFVGSYGRYNLLAINDSPGVTPNLMEGEYVGQAPGGGGGILGPIGAMVTGIVSSIFGSPVPPQPGAGMAPMDPGMAPEGMEPGGMPESMAPDSTEMPTEMPEESSNEMGNTAPGLYQSVSTSLSQANIPIQSGAKWSHQMWLKAVSIAANENRSRNPDKPPRRIKKGAVSLLRSISANNQIKIEIKPGRWRVGSSDFVGAAPGKG